MRKIVSLLMMMLAIAYYTLAICPATAMISRDSMRTKWDNGKKFLMHKVQKGETFYSISRDYKVEVKDLMNANKGVTQLKTGQIIQVPVPENYSAKAKQTDETVKAPDVIKEKTELVILPKDKKPVAETISSNVYHTVKKGETLSAIARKYNMSSKEIASLNNLSKNQINVNEKLLVKKESKQVTSEIEPTKPGLANTTADATEKRRNYEYDHEYGLKAKYHTVAKGETLYSIAKKYGASTSDIIAWNGIKNNSIKTGEQLIVEKGTTTPAEETVRTKVAQDNATDKPKTAEIEKKVNDVKEIATDNTREEVKSNKTETNADNLPPMVTTNVIDKTPSGKNIKQSIETGEASWVNDGDLSPNKYFALHRTAPTGTIMKVTNRMNGKYVFVKVIGKLPGTGDNENLIIKISKAASERLGVLDPTFQCELNYAFAAE